MSLARRHRPKKFETLLGSRSTIQAVEGILQRPPAKIPHAFLITGPSGTGKTTLARIIIKNLGIVGSDFTELDTADFRGIDTVRQLRQQMQYRGLEGTRRGWLLDEAHQLTKDAQEALLKALEEAPAHAFFILATTDPDKLKPTLKRRCVHFAMSPIHDGTMLKYLEGIAEQEGKIVPDEVLKQIAMDSLGSPGMALAVLEKILDLPIDKMLKAARQATEQQNEAIALARILFKKPKWPEVAKLIKTIEGEPESLRRLVLTYCTSVLLGNDNPQAYVVMDAFKSPFFDDAKAKLVMACYEVVNA